MKTIRTQVFKDSLAHCSGLAYRANPYDYETWKRAHDVNEDAVSHAMAEHIRFVAREMAQATYFQIV